jgi:hypothetical protein
MEGIPMTYMIPTSPRLRRRYGNRRPAGLGGWAEDQINAGRRAVGLPPLPSPPSGTAVCLASANANTANLDAKINDLAKNWHPTGFYTPAQVRALVSNVMAVIANARSAVAKAQGQTGLAEAAQSNLRQSLADMARQEARSLEYLAAASAATSSGAKAVNAPGMKTWVTNAMNAASSAFVTADVVSCELPFWIAVMAGFLGLVGSVVEAIKKIVGVAIAAGEAVLDVARDAAESIPVMWQIVKWGGLAALGVLAVWKLKEYRKSGSL